MSDKVYTGCGADHSDTFFTQAFIRTRADDTVEQVWLAAIPNGQSVGEFDPLAGLLMDQMSGPITILQITEPVVTTPVAAFNVVRDRLVDMGGAFTIAPHGPEVVNHV